MINFKQRPYIKNANWIQRLALMYHGRKYKHAWYEYKAKGVYYIGCATCAGGDHVATINFVFKDVIKGI